MVDLEKIISEMTNDVEFRTKTVIGTVIHGSSKGEPYEYTLYYNTYGCEWTSKEEAIRSHILSKITPIIHKLTTTT